MKIGSLQLKDEINRLEAVFQRREKSPLREVFKKYGLSAPDPNSPPLWVTCNRGYRPNRMEQEEIPDFKHAPKKKLYTTHRRDTSAKNYDRYDTTSITFDEDGHVFQAVDTSSGGKVSPLDVPPDRVPKYLLRYLTLMNQAFAKAGF